MKLTLIICAALLTGCAGFDPSKFENRLACTVSKDRAYVVSEYGPVGITGRLADQDRAAICK